MEKNLRIFSIIIVLCFFLTGCWDSKDVEKRDILATLIVDKKDDNYYYYTRIANTSGMQKDGGAGEDKFRILIGEGKSFADARDDLNRKLVKDVFLGAARILIFTDRIAESGIEEYSNRLRGQIDYRKSIPIATTSNEPLDIFNIKPENAESIGIGVESTLNSLAELGTSFKVDIGDVLESLAVRNASFLLPDVNIEDDKIALTGYSVFIDAKESGKISAEDRNGIVYLLNPKARFYYEITQNKKKYIIGVQIKSKKVNTEYVDSQLKMDVNMSFVADIALIDKMEPITQEDVDAIKSQLEERLKKDLEKAVDTSQHEFKCDYLNFYKYFRIKYYEQFEEIDWCKVYSNAKVNITTKVDVSRSHIPLKE